MTKITIQEISKDSTIEILGHKFHGLEEIKKAVEKYCRVNRHRDAWEVEPKVPVEGLHVTCVYEPYPCFDSEDYANENCDYSNYFFSTKPLTKPELEYISRLPRDIQKIFN